MSKFIKVTFQGTSISSLIAISNITSIGNEEVYTTDGFVRVNETIEQIEAQLLRDEFAMTALPSFINTRVTVEQATRQAYVYADAMLKERLK